ncbi:uncharacterized protein [Eurosta solidaginis]|uniref:uncharacterized protein n=1 Tax=Eurosta solidaginis TaxID=178769 RepID=UPI00353070EE
MKNKDGKSQENSDTATEPDHPDTEGCNFGLNPIELPYLWYPNQESVSHLEYVRRLECEFTCLQRAFLALTTQFARLQFRVRQIVQSDPCERDALLLDLEHMAFNAAEENDELPPIQRDSVNMGDVRRKQNYIIQRLREQLCALAEADSWQPIPEAGAEPPAPDSVIGVTCCCNKKKRIPPPETPNTGTSESERMSSSASTHSNTSRSRGEMGMASESPSEYDPTRNGSLKQRVSYGDEQALGMDRKGNTSFPVQAACACVEVCQEKLTLPERKLELSYCNEVHKGKMICPAPQSKPCDRNKAICRHMNNNNNCEHK